VLKAAQTPQRLLLYLILTSGTLSALLVNDTVCFMFTPLVVAVVVRGGLPLLGRSFSSSWADRLAK